MKTLLRILLWIWQAPQNIVGLAFRLILCRRIVARVQADGACYCIMPSFPGGISLGSTIFVKYGFLEAEIAWKHEYGHTIQSRLLGPFYLLIIGLPSLLWAWYWTPARGISYYSFFTEKWADQLGKVKREN